MPKNILYKKLSIFQGKISIDFFYNKKQKFRGSTMGKRGPKNRYIGKGGKGTKKPNAQWKVRAIPEDHQMFRNYYQEQLGLQEKDFKQFWAKMKQKLPIVFRVNPNCPRHQSFCNKISKEEFIKGLAPIPEDEKMKESNQAQLKQIPKLECIEWYPGNIVYTMNTNKAELKKSKIYTEFHKYLQQAFDSGLISRQELVSMLPPLYLNVSPDDMVLDLCAAPGSKTSQILEMMYGERRWLSKGCVVANDADYSRAQMLIHQLHRSGTAGMVAINHPGQFMPEFYTHKIGSVKQRFQFDKILCDVPCSGDGATRKLPIKWATWHTSDGMVLHPLQLSILMKAVNLLKRGGSLVYSTCSLNPLENEAVIHALLQKVGKGLEVIDIHSMFDVKGRRGLLTWKVLAIQDDKANQKMVEGQEGEKKKYLRQYKTYEQAKNTTKIKPTIFPPISEQQAVKMGLHHTMRILPHDQNSGGFYVALLRKLPNFQWKYSAGQKQKISPENEAELERQFLENNLPEVQNIIPNQHDDEQQQLQKKQPQNMEEQGENQGEQNQEQVEKVEENYAILEEQENIQIVSAESEKRDQKQQFFQKKAVDDKIPEDKKRLDPKKKKQISSKYERFQNMSHEQFLQIEKFYGIGQSFQKLLYVRENANTKKKVILISEGARQFLQADHFSKLKLVNMGTQAFERSKQAFIGNQCFFRLCQDGIHFLLEHIKHRKIQVPLQFFKKVIQIKSLAHEQIEDQEIKNKIQKLSQGSFCFYIDQLIDGKHIIDAVVGQNFKNSFHTMVSKQDTESLAMRYL